MGLSWWVCIIPEEVNCENVNTRKKKMNVIGWSAASDNDYTLPGIVVCIK